MAKGYVTTVGEVVMNERQIKRETEIMMNETIAF
jgi:hypothetical protein